MIHYCDCRKKDGTKNHRAILGYGKMRKTSVDKDEACIYCGYTAFAMRTEVLFRQWRYSHVPAINKELQTKLKRLEKDSVWLK